MKQSLNVAVFGFSLNVLEQLKCQILESIPNHVKVDWVNISEQKIDLLMVNDVFFHSTNIQKVVENQVFEYLRLVKDIDRCGEITADVLCYPLYHRDSFSEWMQHKFFEYKPEHEAVMPKKKGMAVQTDLGHVIREMFIPRNGYIKIYDQNGFLALVDCMTERVWLEPRAQSQFSYSNLNHTYATGHFVNDVIRDKKAKDLRAWLWRDGIYHRMPQTSTLSKQQYFKLNVWPQFNSGAERRHLMKMAACFASGAKLNDVAKTLNIGFDEVEAFVHRAELLQFGTFIQEHDAKFALPREEMNTSTGQSIRNFFGKLRKKIGL
jgi:hypothetical protein